MSRWRIDWKAGGNSRRPLLHLYWSEAGLWSFETPGQPGRAWAGFEAFAAAHAGRRLRLWVGSAWVHSLVVPPDLPLSDTDALERYARLQLAHYFGAGAEHWPLASWQIGAQRGACALQETVGGLSLAAVRESVQAHGLRLLSLRPLWCQALAHASGEDGAWAASQSAALALLEGRLLSCLVISAGQLVDIQQRYLDRCDGGELQSLLDELRPPGAGHPPRLMGWGQPERPEARAAWPSALAAGPQHASWLCTGAAA